MSNIFETIKLETVPNEESDNMLGAEIILASGEEMVAIDIPEESTMCENEFVNNRKNEDFSESYILMLTDGSLKFLEDFPEEPTFVDINNLETTSTLTLENQLQCSYDGCGKKFLSTSQLKTHQRKHNGTSPHECDYCGKSFSTGYALKAHRRTHTGEKPYICPEADCQKKFKTSGDLQKHIRTHTGERPFKCGVCCKAFTTSNIRKVHMRVHTGEKPYECTHSGCQRRFSSATNYRNHLRIHTGEKPYVCSVQSCLKRFTEYSSLYKHYTVHSQKKRYECSVCSRQYRQLSTLNIHINTIHKPGGTYRLKVEGSKPGDPLDTSAWSPKKPSDCLAEEMKIAGSEVVYEVSPSTSCRVALGKDSIVKCSSSSSASSNSCLNSSNSVVEFEPLKAITCGSEAILVLSVPSAANASDFVSN